MARPYKSPYKKSRKSFVPGKDRTGGFYGRYTTASGAPGELKFHDLTIDDAVVSGAGTIGASFNLIAQGVTESERIGRKCTLKSIWWKYSIGLPEQDAVATPVLGDCVRQIVFLDKQANGAAAVVTDVLETAAFNSFRNLANQDRFTILQDKNHDIQYAGLASDGAGVVSQAGVTQNYQWHKKCNVPIEFSSTTGALSEVRSNNIGSIHISRNGVASFLSEIRVRFSDGGR